MGNYVAFNNFFQKHRFPEPGNDDIFLYSFCIQPDTIDYGGCESLLSEEENKKASSFIFEKDRYSYIITQCILRKLLSLFMDCEPDEIIFRRGSKGKPYIFNNTGNLFFNISHSRDLLIVGLSRNVDIGVDVEYIRPLDNLDQLANISLSDLEQQDFFRSDFMAINKLELFYNYWTHKEAYLKATGEGLSRPPEQVEFQLTLYGTLKLHTVTGNREDSDVWSVLPIRPAANYIGAVAFKNMGHGLKSHVYMCN